MRILVTNDDGLHAPGIHALAAALDRAGHELVLIAPEGDRSGSGAAIGNLGDGSFIRYRPMPLPGLEHVESYELDGPPALCVFAAHLRVFGPAPDLVASGVNPGLNTGRVTLHSGTVGAALTAASLGMSAVAVSIAGREATVRHWDVAADLAVEVAEWLEGEPVPTTVNLSVPDRARRDLADLRYGTLAPFGAVRAEALERTADRIEVGLVAIGGPMPPESDTALVEAGHPVVTALTGIRGSEPAGLVDHLSARRAATG